MKHILFIFLLAGCSSVPMSEKEEAQVRQDLTEMTKSLEDITYAIHQPIYGTSLD